MSDWTEWAGPELTELEKKRRAKFARLVPKYSKALFKGRTEEDMQKFLAENPELAMEAFNDGSAQLDLVAKFPLGTEYVTDFVVLGVRSYGIPYHCIFVELESPIENPFTKAGVFSAKLNQAVKQVTEWDHWLRSHFDEFCMSLPRKLSSYQRSDLPVKLRSAFITFKIVIGRRSHLSTKNREYRSSFLHVHQGKIEIMSYDRILTRARLAAGERILDEF
jgi:hypothetical protein